MSENAGTAVASDAHQKSNGQPKSESNGAGNAERAWVEKLKAKNMLLECPPALLKTIFRRCYGKTSSDSTKILFQQMAKNVNKENFGCYGIDDSFDHTGLFDMHVKLLQTLPASSVAVVEIIALACRKECEVCHEDYDCVEVLRACSDFDIMLDRLIKHVVDTQSARRPYIRLVPIIDQVRKVRRLHGDMLSGMEFQTDEGWLDTEPNPSYLESTARLAKWHAKSTSMLVVQKIAGHVLPPELLEMISSCWMEDVEDQIRTMRRNAAKFGDFYIPSEDRSDYEGCPCGCGAPCSDECSEDEWDECRCGCGNDPTECTLLVWRARRPT